MKYLIIAIAVSIANPVFAGMYKCINASGNKTYQQTPCATVDAQVKMKKAYVAKAADGQEMTDKVELGYARQDVMAIKNKNTVARLVKNNLF